MIQEKDVSIDRELIHHIPEHQVLLTFNSDWMAECFENWWDLNFRNFQQYSKEYKEEN